MYIYTKETINTVEAFDEIVFVIKQDCVDGEDFVEMFTTFGVCYDSEAHEGGEGKIIL